MEMEKISGWKVGLSLIEDSISHRSPSFVKLLMLFVGDYKGLAAKTPLFIRPDAFTVFVINTVRRCSSCLIALWKQQSNSPTQDHDVLVLSISR
jgi:hypothetical protein